MCACLTGRNVQLSYTVVCSNNPLLTSVLDVLGHPWTYHYSTTTGQVDFLTTRLSPPVDLTGGGAAPTPITLESLSYTLSSSTVTQLVTSRGNGQLTTTYDFQPGGLNETHETTAGQVTRHRFNNGIYAGLTDADGHTSSQKTNFVFRPILQL